jgi:hypothetical protein
MEPFASRGALQPPRWLFHAVAAALCGCLLFALSHPGVDFLPLLLVVPALIGCAGLWGAWSVSYLRRREWSWWFLVAPLGSALVLGLAAGDVPLKTRWALSRPAFEEVVAALPATPPAPADADADSWPTAPVPSRIGLYGVLEARLVPGGVLFTDSTGSLGDDAGFAFLPAGPGPDLGSGGLERPRFRGLGGPWYAWTAGW